MSRRPPNPAAERAAQNQQTIKSLLKLEANKICADCKRNKHPRWASWNLGVFVCIRCSGIHRGMGTHISRVKSVDLDAWTDEQLQSILSWGNARANKYWEAKLAAGHAPSEAKIENFIRTKYELKRWVMGGPMPDPSTLDAEADDDIPLSLVKEKQNIERKVSNRKASEGPSSAPRSGSAQAAVADLIGGDDVPPRASTTGPVNSKVPPKASPAPPKATNPKDSLLGLDFLGESPAAPPRPASTASTGGLGGQSRPDLKQSILSLYASAPRPQAQPQQTSHTPSGSASFSGFVGMPSPSMQSPTASHQSQKSTSGGGLDDAFASLSFGSVSSPKAAPKDAFAGLTSVPSNRSTPQPSSAFSNLSGGGFFDPKPSQPAVHQQQPKPSLDISDSFGGFASPPAPAPAPAPARPAAPSSSALGDLFDFSTPAPEATKSPPPPQPAPSSTSDSVFNLSANPPKPTSSATPAPPAASPLSSVNASFSSSDVWGNAWSEPEPVAPPAEKSPAAAKPNDFGWGAGGDSFANQSIVPGASGGFSTAPKVAADEEFGGWTSSTGAGTNTNAGAKPVSGGFGGNDDLFSNVWQ